MILSFTKELASILSLELKASKSEVFMVTPLLDDWVISCLWNREEHFGLTLIHKHSLFSLLLVSEVKDLFYCLDLFYEQLLDLLTEMDLNEEKYLAFFDNLFQNIHALKNDDKIMGSQIGFLYKQLELYEKQARDDGIKLRSIDISRRINSTPRSKLHSATPSDIFANLLQNHYSEPILEMPHAEEKPVTVH